MAGRIACPQRGVIDSRLTVAPGKPPGLGAGAWRTSAARRLDGEGATGDLMAP